MATNEISIALTTPGFDKVQTDFDKLTKKQKELILSGSEIGRSYERMRAKIDGVGQSAKKAGDAQKEGFGSKAVAQLASVALGYIGISQAIGAANSALAAHNAAKREGAQSILSAEAAERRLGQLGGDAKDYDRRVKLAHKIAMEQGVDRTTAANFVFDAVSLGQEKNAFSMSRIMRTGGTAVDAAKFMAGVAGVKDQFGDAAGTEDQIAASLFALAEQSPVSGPDFAPHVMRAAAAGKMMGATPEEIGATLSQVAKVTGGDPSEAVTQMNAFATQMTRLGIKGNYLEAAAKIEAMGLNEQGLLEKLQNQRAIAGYVSILAQRELIPPVHAMALAAKAKGGTPEDPINRMITNIESPDTESGRIATAAIKNRRAALAKEISGATSYGIGELDADTLIDEAERRLSDANAGPGEKDLRLGRMKRLKDAGRSLAEIAEAGGVSDLIPEKEMEEYQRGPRGGARLRVPFEDTAPVLIADELIDQTVGEVLGSVGDTAAAGWFRDRVVDPVLGIGPVANIKSGTFPSFRSFDKPVEISDEAAGKIGAAVAQAVRENAAPKPAQHVPTE